jgi:hypothetical protein
MALTPEQMKEAEALYIRTNITALAQNIADAIAREKTLIEASQVRIKVLQEKCPHPLIARATKNHGSGGDWDERTYWTTHKCSICDLFWSTSQRWEYVGGRMGLPDDEEAKEK